VRLKEEKALEFQRVWLEFDERLVLEKLEEYWKRYRFLGDIMRIIDFGENRKILDVGSGGPSSVLNLIKGERYGVDPLIDDLLKIYELNKEIRWKKAYAEKLPFENEFFDIVISSNSLDHVENVKYAMEEIKRVLKSNGTFLLTVDTFRKRFKRDEKHPHTFTEDDVIDILEDFKISFRRLSKSNAHFYSFLKGRNVEAMSEYGELVIIATKE